MKWIDWGLFRGLNAPVSSLPLSSVSWPRLLKTSQPSLSVVLTYLNKIETINRCEKRHMKLFENILKENLSFTNTSINCCSSWPTTRHESVVILDFIDKVWHCKSWKCVPILLFLFSKFLLLKISFLKQKHFLLVKKYSFYSICEIIYNIYLIRRGDNVLLQVLQILPSIVVAADQ